MQKIKLTPSEVAGEIERIAIENDVSVLGACYDKEFKGSHMVSWATSEETFHMTEAIIESLIETLYMIDVPSFLEAVAQSGRELRKTEEWKGRVRQLIDKARKECAQ